MSEKRKSFALRISPEIFNALEKWAADELRSVNGHIEFLLREALKDVKRLPNSGDKNEKPEGN